jgi:polyisoprenoid-binding protein YceI
MAAIVQDARLFRTRVHHAGMDTLTLGPEHGTLSLHTGVEGRAAKMGHNLTIALTEWSAEATFEGEAPTGVQLRAPLASMQVVRGEGGIKPVSDKDKQTIRENALSTLKAAQHPDVSFASTSVRVTAGGFALDGELAIAGATRPVTVEVAVADNGEKWTVTGEATVVQSEHGVKPYSGMMGGLKVRDRVDVRVEASVPKT